MDGCTSWSALSKRIIVRPAVFHSAGGGVARKLQEAMQKNGKNLCDNVRDIVIPFFKDDTDCEKANHVKFNTFDVGGCQSIMNEDNHVFQDFNTLQPQAPTIDGPPALASAPARTRARAGPLARARARAGLPVKRARPCPPIRRKPSPPARARGRSAARQDVTREGRKTASATVRMTVRP